MTITESKIRIEMYDQRANEFCPLCNAKLDPHYGPEPWLNNNLVCYDCARKIDPELKDAIDAIEKRVPILEFRDIPTPTPDRPCGVNYTGRFSYSMDGGQVSRSIEYGTSMPDIQIRIAYNHLDVAGVEHFLMAVIKDIKEKGLYTVERADEVAEREKQAIRSGQLIPACPDGDLPW